MSQLLLKVAEKRDCGHNYFDYCLYYCEKTKDLSQREKEDVQRGSKRNGQKKRDKNMREKKK